ncbi:MAG: HAD family hydrolase [Myxococcales bacterium]|jgi:phosphoglycolate phosphatase|nr:HAD family hydrolase [Myxococcales bacterium]
MIRAVVTDMDNTLYSWVDYIVPSTERMLETLCRVLSLPRIQVIQALKEVYDRYESNDYPFAIQESRLFDPYRGDFPSFSKLVIEPASEAFAAARKRYLRPYRGVIETLRQLEVWGIPVVALTDAPRNPAERRAYMMGLDESLTALYALPAFPFPETGIAPEIRKREEAGGCPIRCEVVELRREDEKPNSRGFLAICERLGVPPHEVALVGDSLSKDMRLARQTGAIGCWAEYGTYISAEYQERLDILSAPKAMRRHLRQAPDSTALPRFRLSCFDQLLGIIESENSGALTTALPA